MRSLLLGTLSKLDRVFSRTLTTQKPIRICFETADATLQAVGKPGDSLLDVVVNADLPIDGFGACEGTLACCTCHVILRKEHWERIDPPGEEELDLLDLAPELTDTSRLGCQIILTEADPPEIAVRLPTIVDDARLS